MRRLYYLILFLPVLLLFGQVGTTKSIAPYQPYPQMRNVVRELIGREDIVYPDIFAILESTNDPVQPLMEKLSAENDINRRIYLLALLGHLGDPQAWDVIADCIGDTEPRIRAQTIVSLVAIRHPYVVNYLKSAILDSSPIVRKYAMNLAGEYKYPKFHKESVSNNGDNDLKASPLLIGQLENPDKTVWISSAQSIQKIKDANVVIPLMQALEKHPGSVDIIKALGEQQDQRAVNSLLKNLSTKDTSVGIATVEALAKIGDIRAAKTVVDYIVNNLPISHLSIVSSFGSACIKPIEEYVFLKREALNHNSDSYAIKHDYFILLYTLASLQTPGSEKLPLTLMQEELMNRDSRMWNSLGLLNCFQKQLPSTFIDIVIDIIKQSNNHYLVDLGMSALWKSYPENAEHLSIILLGDPRREMRERAAEWLAKCGGEGALQPLRDYVKKYGSKNTLVINRVPNPKNLDKLLAEKVMPYYTYYNWLVDRYGYDSRVTKYLVDLLLYNDVKYDPMMVRMRALEALIKIGTPEVKEDIYQAAIRIGSDKTIELKGKQILSGWANIGPNEVCERMLWESLGSMGDERAFDHLVQWAFPRIVAYPSNDRLRYLIVREDPLTYKHHWKREATYISLLVKLDTNRILPLLKQQINHPHEYIRGAVKSTLLTYGDSDTARAVAESLDVETPYVREVCTESKR